MAGIKIGTLGEDIACRYLVERGYKILDRNWNCRWGEIDIVAEKGSYIIFCEVKTRSSDKYGKPYESVTYYKKRSLARAIKRYIFLHNYQERSYRCDVLSILKCRGNFSISHFESVPLE